jgi:hypothetical protein
MAASPITRWLAVRFLPLSAWDYVAIAASVAGLVREVIIWLG